MKVAVFSIAFFLIPVLGISQDTIIKYYNNNWLEKEVEFKKAKVIKKEYTNEDGSVTTDLLKSSDYSLISSTTRKDKQPYGVWITNNGKVTRKLNYNFKMDYINESCELRNPFKAESYLKDVESENYIAPVFSLEKGPALESIRKNITYPVYAIENELQGTIEVCFTISELGEIQNISILKSIHSLLDKEAARVVNEMKVESPAKLNNEAIPICVKIPITFSLE
jgi:TonB family protein